MTAGERLRELRGIKKFKEFSEPLGIGEQHISNIEKGHSNLSIDLAEKICDIYGCSMDWLIRGIGERNISDVSKNEPYKEKYYEQLEKNDILKDRIIILQEETSKVVKELNDKIIFLQESNANTVKELNEEIKTLQARITKLNEGDTISIKSVGEILKTPVEIKVQK